MSVRIDVRHPDFRVPSIALPQIRETTVFPFGVNNL